MVSAEPWARPSEPTPRSPAPCGLGCHRIIVLWGWHTRRSGVPKWPVGAHRSGGCAGPCWTIAGGIFGNAWGGGPRVERVLLAVPPAAWGADGFYPDLDPNSLRFPATPQGPVMSR